MKYETEQELNWNGDVINEHLVAVYSKREEAEKKRIAKAKRQSNVMKVKLTIIVLLITLLFYKLNLHWYIVMVPLIIHLALAFYVFAKRFYKERNEKRAWAHYIKKYGGKMGAKKNEIHPHIAITHKKLIKQGKKIPV